MTSIQRVLLHSIRDNNYHELMRMVELHHCSQHLLEAFDINQGTAIHAATKTGNLSMLKYILSIAQRNLVVWVNLLEIRSVGGYSALHYACLQDRTDIVELLIQSGADPNLPSNGIVSETPLILCCKKGCLRSALVLINSGADIRKTDSYGNSPAFWCRKYGHDDIIEKLGLGSPLVPAFEFFLEVLKTRNNGMYQLPKVKPKKKKGGKDDKKNKKK